MMVVNARQGILYFISLLFALRNRRRSARLQGEMQLMANELFKNDVSLSSTVCFFFFLK